MPALMPTDYTARIVWASVNVDRGAALETVSMPHMDLTFAGLGEESRAGLTRPSCSRVKSQYPKGTDIRNTRQLSVVSAEELAAIASAMGVDALSGALVGASMVVEVIPDFSHIPPSSRLQDEASGATLTVDMENRPCMLPAKPIEAVHPGRGKAFKAAAKGRRGVTLWVEREGRIAVGDILRLHIPDQPIWAEYETARASAR